MWTDPLISRGTAPSKSGLDKIGLGCTDRVDPLAPGARGRPSFVALLDLGTRPSITHLELEVQPFTRPPSRGPEWPLIVAAFMPSRGYGGTWERHPGSRASCSSSEQSRCGVRSPRRSGNART